MHETATSCLPFILSSGDGWASAGAGPVDRCDAADLPRRSRSRIISPVLASLPPLAPLAIATHRDAGGFLEPLRRPSPHADADRRASYVVASGVFSGGTASDDVARSLDGERTDEPRAERATEGAALALRLCLAGGALPADRAAFLAMEGYGALYVLCVRSARRGRMLGSIGRGADVPVPPPVSVEDDETATDAIGEAWALLAKGAEHPAPVLLARSIAKRLGQRRAQHRIRLRTGLTDAPTDRTMPADDAKRTVAELLAVASPARRAALGRALAQRQEGKRGRKATGAVPMTGAERVAKHRKAKRESNANTSARV